jgi:hypothetical protein
MLCVFHRDCGAHVAVKHKGNDKVIYPVCHEFWNQHKDKLTPVKTIGEYRLAPEDIIQ